MVLDPRKRQKKLEKRTAKQKAKQKERIQKIAMIAVKTMEMIGSSPILHSSVSKSLWDRGIGQAVLSRVLPDGRVAASVFLLDVYCLGVKNAMFVILDRPSYEEKIHRGVNDEDPQANQKPAYVRKLVEEAVAYAGRLSFLPHPDYEEASLLLGDIDAGACQEEFQFGKNGKPFYISGPYENSIRSRQIVDILNDRCGSNGFEYIVRLRPSSDLPLDEGSYPEGRSVEIDGADWEDFALEDDQDFDEDEDEDADEDG